MSPMQYRDRALKRLSSVLGAAITFCAIVACSVPGCTSTNSAGTHVTITLCAVDARTDTCSSGDFQALHQTQHIRLRAAHADGTPLAATTLQLNIAGANAGSLTATTANDGAAEYTYVGNSTGTDTISATHVAGSTTTLASGPVVIHWLKQQSIKHPLIFVHGISEDANDYAHQITPSVSDADQASSGEGGEQAWSALFTALGMSYDAAYMQAFCYIDDKAYTAATPNCPSVETQECVTPAHPIGSYAACLSQSSVDRNALALAKTVNALSAAAGGAPVTLMAYSMGGAVVRTLLAGCQRASVADALTCTQAVGSINHAFFLNGAQQGSWLLRVKAGADAATLAGQGIPGTSGSPFTTMLPMVEQNIFGAVKDTLGLDLTDDAETDLTPQSANIVAHNLVAPPPAVDFYTFYGDVELGLSLNILTYHVPAKSYLQLGDLVMLAQDDRATYAPLWGGGALCDGCPQPLAPYREGGSLADGRLQYHAWALTDAHSINMNTLAPLLSAPDAASGLQAVVNSPVQHLNVSQPLAQAPGSAVQVKDITGLAGSPTTDETNEIITILLHLDGAV